MHVANFDLNLLKTLDALLDARSVTRAAKQVGLSQPAASHALGRLRAALGDPLLVRVGAAQVLTERAEHLREPVKEALRKAELVLSPPEGLQPANLKRSFTINLADYTELGILPGLTERLSREAPGVSVRRLPTPYGALTYSIRREKSRLLVELPEGNARPPGGLIVKLPGREAVRVERLPARFQVD